MQPTSPEPLEKPNFWRANLGPLPKAVIGGIFWITGLMMICFGLLQIVSELRYKTDGVTADGLVTKLVTSEGEDSKTYHVEYRFDTPHGQVDGSSEVPLELWTKLQVNAPVGIQYRAHNPNSNRLQGLLSIRLYQQNHCSFAYSTLPSCGMGPVRVCVFPKRQEPW